MRIHGSLERGISNLNAGRERRRVAAAAFRGNPVRPPAPGTLLKTLRVTDHLKGISYVVTLHQGRRRNAIVPLLFGRSFMRAASCGFDLLFRELRRRWSLRWIIEN
jgi:hypothetical protein